MFSYFNPNPNPLSRSSCLAISHPAQSEPRMPPPDPPHDAPDLLRRAREHLRGDRPTHAEAVAEVALAWDPASDEAMEILGRTALLRGDLARAAAMLATAAACRETAPRLANLARAWFALGRREEAVAAFRRAAILAPEDGVLANDLGAALAQTGQVAAAEAAFRRAVALLPDMAEARGNLATALRELGRSAEAAALAPQAAPTPTPDPAGARDDLADVHFQQKRHDEAITAGREAAALRPDDARLRRRHANRLQLIGRLVEAEAELRRALAVDPDSAGGQAELGWVLRRQDRLDEALAVLRTAAARWPDDLPILNGLSVALLDSGRPEEALAMLDRAVALYPNHPEHPELQHNRATILLRLGRFREGWELYEWRWRMAQGAAVRRHFAQKLWTGEDLGGRRILLHAEQGLGDTLQFLRFVPLVVARGGRVVLELPAPLAPLAAGLDGVAELVWAGDELPDFELHCPLLSLPRAFGTLPETLPPPPYLAADPRHLAAWRDRLVPDGRLQVGLVWAGRSEHRDDARRSMPFAALTPLWQVPGVRWFSLQVGPRGADLAAAPPGMVTDLAPLLGDFADTAAALGALDLLVGVDTATVHLAGALGRPAWLLLPYAADWRWMRDAERTVWYPSLRLFRQSSPGAWPDVIARIVTGLAGGQLPID